jgi:signal transduction histidine kinase
MEGKRSSPSLGRALRSRGFPLACCFSSLALHASAGVLPFSSMEGAAPPYAAEYVACVAICAGLSAGSYLVRGRAAFRILHGFRFFFLCFALAFVARASLLAPLFLCGAFLFETALAEALVPAAAIDAAALLAFGFVVALARGLPASLPGAAIPLGFALFLAAVAALSCLAADYRERLVERNAEVSRLADTVRNLIGANLAFQAYANRIESDSREKERNRITRELHDSVGYALTNVIVMMNAGKVLLKENPGALGGLFDKVGAETESALANTRQILHILREIQATQRYGLDAIVQLAENFRGATGVEIDLSFGNFQGSYGRDIDNLLFRFVQEGLTNAFRHGKASRVAISMQQTEGELAATIRDNGSGLPAGVELVEGIGFSGMRERLADLGGTIIPRNAVDGFELRAVIPYRVAG